ncbi:hypothetical protein ACFLTA_00300 [Bacteroidota bacterium]
MKRTILIGSLITAIICTLPWIVGVGKKAEAGLLSTKSHQAENIAISPAIPELLTDYVLIYNPQPDVYSGKSTQTYISGKTYNQWQPNDHTFIAGPKGRWHCFGVTKPLELPDERAYEAEGQQTFHALAPEGTLEQAFLPETWIDQTKFSVAGSGESPYAIKIGKSYDLISSSLGHASSKDLNKWKDNGRLQIKGAGRDPNILYWNGTYYLVRCNGRTVNLVSSTDFENWTDPIDIFETPVGSWLCESPTLLRYEDSFYLFWCLWDSSPDRKKLLKLYKGHDPKNYDFRTFVYASDKPTDFNNREPIAKLKAHAPEIVVDEQGNYFISSADYPRRGINLARLGWKSE